MFKKVVLGMIAVMVMAIAGVLPADGAGVSGTGGAANPGSVIFFHPDGAGLNHWDTARIFLHGPDGRLNWDNLSNMAVYTGHMKDCLVGTSNGGAVTHAYGVKVHRGSYGLLEDGVTPVTSLSGRQQTIMEEAVNQGLSTALINSGSIIEPGTGAFVARVPSRRDYDEITRQVVESGVDVILSGGEVWFLPEGVRGRHGEMGRRTDGRNLIERAGELGYTIVYTRAELLALPNNTRKVLGIFAPMHTFNDHSEEKLRELGLPNYWPTAPTIAEMLEKTLEIFETRRGQRFFIVAEEEGTDNFANANNANGTLEALQRADEAIGVAQRFIKRNPNTMLITAADSEAGSMGLVRVPANQPVPAKDKNGAPRDGVGGTETLPFMSAPDARGQSWPFAIAWGTFSDTGTGVIAKAHGRNAHKLPSMVDNTDIYRMKYLTLFWHMAALNLRLAEKN